VLLGRVRQWPLWHEELSGYNLDRRDFDSDRIHIGLVDHSPIAYI
jgi:hypothetical protein